jgi:hypothetical protein
MAENDFPDNDVKNNESRCPHEEAWFCTLLNKPCHPGMRGCILFGQALMDALIAFERKEHVIDSDEESNPKS